MDRVGIFYGSDSGVTSAIAHDIAIELNSRGFETYVIDVIDASVEDIGRFDNIILGTPTLGDGVAQEDWERILSAVSGADFSAKKVALFGTGDQVTYPDTFADGLGALFYAVSGSNAHVVGRWSTDGYKFRESKGVIGDKFAGLVIDMDTQPYHSSARITDWVDQISSEFRDKAN